MCSGLKRGQAGAEALKKNQAEIIRRNTINLKKTLKYFKDNNIPIIQKELALEAKISIATLNRSPYKEIVKEYLQKEKVLLSPNGKQEFLMLIEENKCLKEELKLVKEKYQRLKKEIIYSKELFS